jgi:hypothetical protein
MPFYLTTVILLILILASCVFAVYLLLKSKEPPSISSNYKIFNKVFKNEYKESINKQILDPHELKLIHFLSKNIKGVEITVNDINQLLNLGRLSTENQRQRRHIILRELNLKLYLMTGIRETIVRVASDKDKRIKSYIFHPEVLADTDFSNRILLEM